MELKHLLVFLLHWAMLNIVKPLQDVSRFWKITFAISMAMLLGIASGMLIPLSVQYFRDNPQPLPLPDVWIGQWHGDLIGAYLAYDLGYRGQGVKIAILDTGIDFTHFDFNGLPAQGENFVGFKPNYIYDEYGHGSHVAGIIVGQTRGFMGIAPDSEVYSLRVLSAYGSGEWSNVVKAIEWSIENDIDIISMSFSGLAIYAEARGVLKAIQLAYANGILLVASGGNYGDLNKRMAPAIWDEVIAVGAIDVELNVPRWSAIGSHIDLAAPGVRIYSTCTGFYQEYLRQYYWSKPYHCVVSGTSMSAPIVSAAAAVLMSSPIPDEADLNMDGKWQNIEVREWMIKTAFDIRDNGYDEYSGWGVVDLGMALQLGIQAPKFYNPTRLRGVNLPVDYNITSSNIQLLINPFNNS